MNDRTQAVEHPPPRRAHPGVRTGSINRPSGDAFHMVNLDAVARHHAPRWWPAFVALTIKISLSQVPSNVPGKGA
jgi:hypothetical protein